MKPGQIESGASAPDPAAVSLSSYTFANRNLVQGFARQGEAHVGLRRIKITHLSNMITSKKTPKYRLPLLLRELL